MSKDMKVHIHMSDIFKRTKIGWYKNMHIYKTYLYTDMSIHII